MKWELTEEAATALDDLANRITLSMSNIEDSLSRLKQVFNNVSDDVGVHAYIFEEMVGQAESATNKFREAITPLPEAIKKTANDIRNYI